MNRKLCLIAFAAMAVVAGGASIAAQQPARVNLLPGTKPGVFASIEGTALDSTNKLMPNTVIRLRDARLGRVVSSITTDQDGAFSFRGLEPGSYVAEMMSPANDAVLVASPIINIASGETVTQEKLKLPFRLPPLGGILGRSVPSAVAIISAAVGAGVLAKTVVGAPATDRALPGQ